MADCHKHLAGLSHGCHWYFLLVAGFYCHGYYWSHCLLELLVSSVDVVSEELE